MMRLFAYLIPFWLGLMACQAPAEPAARPHILFILADDIGPAQLGSYGSGYYQTPHLDRLAATGVRFTRAYSAAAVCSPTRAALMTGRSPAALHLTDFIPGDDRPEYPLAAPAWQQFLPLEAETLGERFRELGYETALFGKWHLSPTKEPPGSLPFNPTQQGFDHELVTYKPRPGRTDPNHDPHNVDSLTQRARQFLRERDGTRPFFLMISHNSIHDPLMEHADSVAAWAARPLPADSSGHPVWGAMVARLDRSVGRILAALDSLGLAEETLVVFYGDNGAKHAYAAQAPLRAGKGWLYEGGIRVPLLLRWPGRLPSGAVSEALVTSMDFTPALMQAAGAGIPDQLLEGISFWPQQAGGLPASQRDTLYWHYPHYHRGSGMTPGGALRAGDWKLIVWYEGLLLGQGTPYELYHLGRDPGEQKDLAGTAPDTLAALAAAFARWQARVGAQMPRGR